MTDDQAAAEDDELAPYADIPASDPEAWRYEQVDPPELPWPSAVTRWLLPAERPILATRAHIARLTPPAAGLLAATVLAIWSNVALVSAHRATPGNVHLVWLSFLAVALWATWRWLDWRASWIIITPRRVISVYGIARRTLEQLPVTKLRDADMRQGIPGRLLGYATFEFSSIATGHSLQEVQFVPWPEDVHREITALITRPVTPA